MSIGPYTETGILTALACGWVLCAILAGTIASGKNRSYGRWFLVGLLLGPIAVLWITRLHKYVPPEERRPCPKCGRTIEKSATVCRHCRGWVGEGRQIDRAAQVGYVAAHLLQRVRRAHQTAKRKLEK